MRLREGMPGGGQLQQYFCLRRCLHRRCGRENRVKPGTITGSIGVILRGNDLSQLFERIGIR